MIRLFRCLLFDTLMSMAMLKTLLINPYPACNHKLSSKSDVVFVALLVIYGPGSRSKFFVSDSGL